MKTSTFCVLFATMATLLLASAVTCSAEQFVFNTVFNSDKLPRKIPSHDRAFIPQRPVHMVVKQTVADDNPCKVQCKIDFFSCKNLVEYAMKSTLKATAADIKAWKIELKECSQALEGCFGGCSRFAY